MCLVFGFNYLLSVRRSRGLHFSEGFVLGCFRRTGFAGFLDASAYVTFRPLKAEWRVIVAVK